MPPRVHGPCSRSAAIQRPQTNRKALNGTNRRQRRRHRQALASPRMSRTGSMVSVCRCPSWSVPGQHHCPLPSEPKRPKLSLDVGGWDEDAHGQGGQRRVRSAHRPCSRRTGNRGEARPRRCRRDGRRGVRAPSAAGRPRHSRETKNRKRVTDAARTTTQEPGCCAGSAAHQEGERKRCHPRFRGADVPCGRQATEEP